MREPGLPVDAPASPVLTLASLDAGVLVVTLSFHDEFADQVTCSASHRVNREIDGLSVSVPPLSCTDLMRT